MDDAVEVSEFEEREEDRAPIDQGDGLPPAFLWLGDEPNRVTVTIYAYKDRKTGKLRTLTLDVLSGSRDLRLIEYPIETVWTIPTKDQLEQYRQRASQYDGRARAVLVQRPSMQDLLFRYHLQEIKITQPGTDHQIQLERDRRGRLTDATMELIKKLHPSVLDLLFQKYLDDAALIV